jgi:hypothetical protein
VLTFQKNLPLPGYDDCGSASSGLLVGTEMIAASAECVTWFVVPPYAGRCWTAGVDKVRNGSCRNWSACWEQ